MDVLERPVAGFRIAAPDSEEDRVAVDPGALALAFTSAAALVGLVEVLVDRIAVPAMAGALGSSASGITSLLAVVGRVSVSVTAALVLLALLAWSADSRRRRRAFALASVAVVVSTVSAGLFGGRPMVWFAQISVGLAVVAALAAGAKRASLAYTGSLWSIGIAIVAGLWSSGGLTSGSTIAPRAIAEGALVVALVLLGAAVFATSRRGLVPLLGLAAGGGLATLSLASDYTPLVALMAAGAMMWLPSLAYIVAGAAAGYALATWLSDPAKRRLAAGLVLLVVAGVEPVLVHRSAAALLALVALSAAPRNGAPAWR